MILTDLSSRICHSGHVINVQINPKALTPAINSGVFKSCKIDFRRRFDAPYDSRNSFNCLFRK